MNMQQSGQAMESTMALPRTERVVEDFAMPVRERTGIEGKGVSHGGRWGAHARVSVLVGAIVASLALLAAVAGGVIWYFHDRAAWGVMLGSNDVSGQNARELEQTVQQAVSNARIMLRDANGHEASATFSDLGVEPQVQQTVDMLLQAKRHSIWQLFTPWQRQAVPLKGSWDNVKLHSYVSRSFIESKDRAVPSTVTYNAHQQQFQVVDGKAGRSVQMREIEGAVRSLMQDPSKQVSVPIAYTSVATPISEQTAQAVSTQANDRLQHALTIRSPRGKQFTIPRQTVQSWVKFDSDIEHGTMALHYDRDAITAYITQTVPERLNQTMESEQEVVNSAGQHVITMKQGQDGVSVEHVQDIADTVYDALLNNHGLNIEAPSTIQPHDVKKRVSDMRIVVDKTLQIATVFQNDQPVRTFNICSGGNNRNESDNGTFFIYLRFQSQDMNGLNDDGSEYHSKGVKWVSYYNGGEGFHTALWNYAGIAAGDPAHHGSHGCINMYEQDAQWVYEHCPEGTLVQVIGQQPTQPVRG